MECVTIPFFSFRKFRLPLVAWILLILPLLVGCESNRKIVNGLEEKEANEILVLLSDKGIEAEKVKSTDGAGSGAQQKIVLWDIAVPNDQAVLAMSILSNAGLPRRRSQNLLNIFSDTGLVPTDMEQKIKYQVGLGSQIASTIRNIDGVLDADVLISFPEEDPLHPDAPKKDITASVYVKHSGVLDDPNSHLASKIKNLVASGVTGLKYENVTLIPDRARFTDFSARSLKARSGEEKRYVSVWTLTIARDSLTRFRILFFSFSVLILFLILALVWLGWKTHPFIKEQGGIKELLNLKSFNVKGSGKASKAKKKADISENEDHEDHEEHEENEEGEESIVDESADYGGDIDVSEDDERRS